MGAVAVAVAVVIGVAVAVECTDAGGCRRRLVRGTLIKLRGGGMTTIKTKVGCVSVPGHAGRMAERCPALMSNRGTTIGRARLKENRHCMATTPMMLTRAV